MTADLHPATAALAALIGQVRDDQLTAPTPCGGITVGELLDHVDSLCVAFTAAAAKTPLAGGGRAPVPDASRLGGDWRRRLPARLGDLARAWREESAWTGTTEAGGNRLPAAAAGAAALDEVIVHGWDLAVATGRTYPGADPALTEAMTAAYRWVGAIVAQHPDGSPGLFGPPVPVPDDAPLLDRLLGLTGRRPGWRPGDAGP
ncbi:TIGR03086 family protein [Planomonospora sp. ID67723]|uniref:TIGR03086 family metal-binding protein n=1 Tax=Planomonospora sp. ID67723 TaxID=2738134 RepID=UPI0018C3721E|nr:TIGR03086 family metal-binding protein [Planomonospora sp. ID67723]MBG0832867.1 TIGR03086 family protein [Planomonospora sp. ID67723]